MPRLTVAARRVRSSSWSSLYLAAERLTRRPSASPSQPRPRPVRVLPRHDADLTLGGRDVLMTETEYFTGPAAGLVKNGEEKAVSQPRAGIEDRLHLGGSQDPGQLRRRLQRDRPAPVGSVLADVVQERFPPAPAARPPYGQQVADPGAVACLMRVERADGRNYVESEVVSSKASDRQRWPFVFSCVAVNRCPGGQ